jgi:hypothetical protein
MSYIIDDNNHIIRFRSELDSVSCRKAYLERERNEVRVTSYAAFIELEWGRENPGAVESINHTTPVGNPIYTTHQDPNASIAQGPMVWGGSREAGPPESSSGGAPIGEWGTSSGDSSGYHYYYTGGTTFDGESYRSVDAWNNMGLQYDLTTLEPPTTLPLEKVKETETKINKKKKKVKEISRFDLIDFED